jgi:5-methyltetrahydrofolate--homocysteine methyltransferase
MEALKKLKSALLNYDNSGAREAAQAVVDEGKDPVAAMEVVMDALREVGEGFGRGELWLPELVLSATTAQEALPILEAEIKRSGKDFETRGTVVIGTVFGDLHTIGKTMVSVLMSAQGFKIIDLGMNVPAEKFLSAVKEHQPDILALSALLTTTAPEQGKVIKALKENGLRENVKIMVGGGAITPEFAEQIGADGYGATAPDAVQLATQLLGIMIGEGNNDSTQI